MDMGSVAVFKPELPATGLTPQLQAGLKCLLPARFWSDDGEGTH